MFELQLGHLCNDRCVFCISGRLTSRRQAPLLAFDLLAERVRRAYADGHRALTFLGGEPTIQPAFLPLVELAVSLGFERIVLFTNGSKAGRTDLVERVLATGGNFEWRFSFQGATEAAHEATTRRKGSFRQLLRAVERVAAHGQPITANTCVVAQNHRSLAAFPALLSGLGVAQLHVDMIHPEDTGNLSLEELAPMMVRYSEIVPHLREMVSGFPAGFDVNVGNLPPCFAPDLAPYVHHGGQPTETTQAHDFGLVVLQDGRDKYAQKQRGKVKVPGCRSCRFDARCSGLFPEYVALFGDGELRPVHEPPVLARARFRDLDRGALTRALTRSAEQTGAGFELRDDGEEGLCALVHGPRPGDRLRLGFGLRQAAPGRATFHRGSVRVLGREGSLDAARGWLRALQAELGAEGWRSHAPLAEDLLVPPSPRIARALGVGRAGAPFGLLEWTDLALEPGGAGATLTLRDPSGAEAVAWVGPTGHGYRLRGGEPSPVLRGGLGALFRVLHGAGRPASSPGPHPAADPQRSAR
jgi:MoaA/NifB/PqqE/SkfB family radical SAM enzyme